MGNSLPHRKSGTCMSPPRRTRTIDTHLEPIAEVQELPTPCEKELALRRATSIGNFAVSSDPWSSSSQAKKGERKRHRKAKEEHGKVQPAQSSQRRLIQIVGPARIVRAAVLAPPAIPAVDSTNSPRRHLKSVVTKFANVTSSKVPQIYENEATTPTERNAAECTKSTTCTGGSTAGTRPKSEAVQSIIRISHPTPERTPTYGQLARQVKCTQIVVTTLPAHYPVPLVASRHGHEHSNRRHTQGHISPTKPAPELPARIIEADQGREERKVLTRAPSSRKINGLLAPPVKMQTFVEPVADNSLRLSLGGDETTIRPLGERRGWRITVHSPSHAARMVSGGEQEHEEGRRNGEGRDKRAKFPLIRIRPAK